MPEPVYWIRCRCGHTSALLETSLSKIIQYRQEWHTGDPFLVFVCQQCKAAFAWNYQLRKAEGVIDEGQKTEEYRSQMSYSFVAGCDDSNCDSLVELIAIRPAGTTEQECDEEVATWTLDGITCANSHQIVRPTPRGKT